MPPFPSSPFHPAAPDATVADPGRRALLAGAVGIALGAPALLGASDARADARAEARTEALAEPFAIGVPSAAPLREDARQSAERRFAAALNGPVRVRRFASAARLVDAAAVGGLDLAVHTALSFATVRALCGCSDPLLRPVAMDGTAGLRAVLIVRADGPRRLADLLDGTILGAAPGTVAGEVVRRGAAADAGHALRFTGDAPDVAVARFGAGGGLALAGHERVDADGGALGGTLERLGDARVLWRSRPIWHGPLALSAGAAASREAVTAALLALAPGQSALDGLGLGRVRGFVAARADDYAPLVRLLRT